METTARKVSRIAAAALLAPVLALFGAVMSVTGFAILSMWSSISPAYAACAVAELVAGPVMALSALWILGSLGRHRIPLWAGGGAAMLAGVVWLAGVLSYVIPCSGPS